MEASQLYKQLEQDFIKSGMRDVWAERMGSVHDFLCENFKERSMGLVCDFTTEINKVYTAVFPSKKVMQNVLDKNETNMMLFVHHPCIWDISKAPEVWQQMDRELLGQFKEKRISIYNLHVPLDNYGEYSTSVTLAKALGIEPKRSFGPYFGAICGVFGKSDLKTVSELKEKVESQIGHKASLYKYGDDNIKEQVVALIAGGGGNKVEFLKEINKAGVNTLVTGVTVKNDYSREAHEFDEQNRINILGGTHYSTEKFACIAIVDYFKSFGLPCEFIEGKPGLEDL